MSNGWIGKQGDSIVVHVRVTPKGGRNAIDGVVEDRLRIRVATAPADGAANEAARKLLARAAGVARSDVALVRGDRAREKTFSFTGIEAGELEKRLLGRVK